MIEINVTGMDVLRKELADVEVSPAIQRAISEAMREYSFLLGPAVKGTALAAAQEYLWQAAERRRAERPRRIVTVEDLEALGIKRLPTIIGD